jgi:hypothetical protein
MVKNKAVSVNSTSCLLKLLSWIDERNCWFLTGLSWEFPSNYKSVGYSPLSFEDGNSHQDRPIGQESYKSGQIFLDSLFFLTTFELLATQRSWGKVDSSFSQLLVNQIQDLLTERMKSQPVDLSVKQLSSLGSKSRFVWHAISKDNLWAKRSWQLNRQIGKPWE